MFYLKLISLCLITSLCLLTSGCLSIEQEIFIQPDGSGDLVLHFSLPDFPQDMEKAPTKTESTEDLFLRLKNEFAGKLPPSLKLKEAKEVKRNGAMGFYAIFQFKNLKDVEAAMRSIARETAKDSRTGRERPTDWSLQIDREGSLTNFRQLFFSDLSDSKVEMSGNMKVELKPATSSSGKTTRKTRGKSSGRASGKPIGKTQETTAESQSQDQDKMASSQIDKQIEQLIYSTVKFRFVLHTPSPIKTSNADIVLNGKTALWDCSLSAFLKDKKPIEMKASF